PLTLGGAVTGLVTSTSNGSPIPGATVSYSGGTAPTDSSGSYRLSSLAPGSYSLTFSASGFNRSIQNATVSAGQTTTQNVALSPLTFSDGLEGGSLSSWTSSLGLTVEAATV